jgi:hypothetical protein
MPILKTTCFAAAALAFSLAAPAAMAQTMAPTKTTTIKTTTTTKPVMTTGKLLPSQKFTTVMAAQATCPADTVVWSSLTSSKAFHVSTSKYYGKTKHGAYVCEKAALAAGYHQAKT